MPPPADPLDRALAQPAGTSPAPAARGGYEDDRTASGPPTGRTPEVERARRRGKRAAHAAVVALALTFIGASAVQIIAAVFATGAAPAGAPGTMLPANSAVRALDPLCEGRVRGLVRALDRANGEAWRAGSNIADEDDPSPRLEAFQRALAPEWTSSEDTEHACATTPEGQGVWEALLRLRRAHEQVLLRDRYELVPLRRDVTSHLAVHLR